LALALLQTVLLPRSSQLEMQRLRQRLPESRARLQALRLALPELARDGRLRVPLRLPGW